MLPGAAPDSSLSPVPESLVGSALSAASVRGAGTGTSPAMDKPERPEEQPPREVSAGAKLVLHLPLPWASCLAGFSGETCGVQPLSPVQADLEPAGTAAAPSEVVPRALPGGDAQNICTWWGPKRAGLEELEQELGGLGDPDIC